jgi:hypothetical protein
MADENESEEEHVIGSDGGRQEHACTGQRREEIELCASQENC